MKNLIVIFFVFFIGFPFFPHGQSPADTSSGPKRYPQVNLFLHLDKSIYQPGETVWFSGYVLNRDRALKAEQNTLYAILTDVVDRKLVVKQRFLIQYGVGKGFLSLPDTLAAGDYWVIAYTNAMLEHGSQPVFRQLISIRTSVPAPFHISSTILPPVNDDTFRVRYRITTSYQGLAEGGKFEYTLFGNTDCISSGVQTIDPFGEVVIPFNLKKVAGKELQLAVKVSQDNLAKGFILPISPPMPITGESNSDRPIRNHVSAGAVVAIDFDSAEYGQRSRVTLHIRVRDSTGRPLSAIFSLAVVSTKRFVPARMPSVAEHNDMPDSITVQTADDAKVYMHPFRADDRLPDSGYILYDGHAPNRPISLALMSNGFTTLTTDSAGRFELPYDLLVAPVGGVRYLSVTEKEVDRYKINVLSKADRISRQLATVYQPIDLQAMQVPEVSDSDEIKGASAPGMLKAAVVKVKIPYQYDGEYNSLHCETDFVCTHYHGHVPQILNCPEVQLDSCRLEKPVEGRTYLFLPDSNRIRTHNYGKGLVTPIYQVVYHCAAPYLPPFVKALEPILLNKPFLAQDFSIDKGTTLGSGLQTTVYWEPIISTYNKDEVTVSFYTNDCTGKFICKIVGLSTAGVINQSAGYTVRSPKD